MTLIIDTINEEFKNRHYIINKYYESFVDIYHKFHNEILRLFSFLTAELKISNSRLGEALSSVRALRRTIEEYESSEIYRRKEQFNEISKLREEVYKQKEENKILISTNQKNYYYENILQELAQSYESELERLRMQIGMIKDNFIATQISNNWLKNEVYQIENSIPSRLYSNVKIIDSITTNNSSNIIPDSNNNSNNTEDYMINNNNTNQLSLIPNCGRSSLERSSKSYSCPPVDTSYSLEKEKIIRQDYVFLKVSRHWSKLYCVLSQNKTLLFFDTANDVFQSRHVISLSLIKRVTPISSPPQTFAVELEYNKEAGGHCVEMAFMNKNDRSLWMVLLLNEIHLGYVGNVVNKTKNNMNLLSI